MSPSKRSKTTRKKAKITTGRSKAARSKKPVRKKSAGRTSRAAVPAVSQRKRTNRGATDVADTLGEWKHDHEVDTNEYTEDDIPPDYGGSQ